MENAESKKIICIDLDYTLISTDILIDQILSFIKSNPFRIFTLLFWLLKSKQYLKEKLLEATEIDIQKLPFRSEVLEFVAKAKQNNSKIVLVTATNQKIAKKINERLGIFDEVFGSLKDRKLKGKNKAKFLEQKFGAQQFDYIGDSISDFPIWKIARNAFLVSNSNFMNFILRRKNNFRGCLLNYKTKFKDFLQLIRIHQWIKNLLVFFPLILAHQFTNFPAIVNSILAFISFSMLASSLYIFNDIVDVDNDRRHPTKKNRPIASGIFSVYTAFFISLSLLIIAFALSLKINSNFTIVCAMYLILSLIYSFWIKKVQVVDIFLLSLFYVVRLYAGSIATEISISNWLLAFSMFFFLSLATFKRMADLKLVNSNATNNGALHPNEDAIQFFQNFGIGSSFASVIVFILYINSEKVLQLYQHPSFLWADAFLLLLWLMLVWNLASKGKIEYDPVLVTVRNPYLILLELIMIVVWAMAIVL
ncbi:MAG: UbiA family prenyltransferase [Candidatus Kapaibacteriota bacterium]